MELSLREPASAITHFIAALMVLGGGIPLLIKSYENNGIYGLIAMLIFLIGMIGLYMASATYHSYTGEEKRIKVLRKIDHMMIYIMIAGSYTPVCLLALDPAEGHRILAIVWTFAIVGMAMKYFWITCPKWLSSTIYIAMGWVILSAGPNILNCLSDAAFGWLLAGGLIYTVGGIVYALKLNVFNAKHTFWNSHAIFHLFIMAGSFCHFVFMYQYIA
ncbi:MAG: hemolysin III family protein [Lachnospiraceae bacterium]|nr:hemolysin III family protein [Lachnospiraceae bacterium]